MPLVKSFQINPSTSVKIWHIKESYDFLIQGMNLKPESMARLNGMKSKIHQSGFLSVRHLLMAFGYNDSDLFYDQNGKPHLVDGKYISITHSFEYAGMIVSAQPVGIDIEKKRKKITVIAKKFIDYEFQYLKEDQTYIEMLTKIWCVKESLYKLYATPGLSFKQHTLVIPFNHNNNKTRAWIDYDLKKSSYQAHFTDIEGFCCAFVL